MKKRGFTLTELLVVMSIIGILSSIALVGIKSSRERANISKAKADISQGALAVTMWYSDKRTYPSSPGKGLYYNLTNTTVPGSETYYDDSVPVSQLGNYYKGNLKDPWGNDYVLNYSYTDPRGIRKHVAIVSGGRDTTSPCDDLFKSLKNDGKSFPTPPLCPAFTGQIDE